MRLGSLRFWTIASALVFSAGAASAVYQYTSTPDPLRHPPSFPTPRLGGRERNEYPPVVNVEFKATAPPRPTAAEPAGREPRRRRVGGGYQPYSNEPDPGLAQFYSQVYSTGSAEAPSPVPMRATTHTNVLVLGIDEGYGGSGRSDTIMVVSLNPDAGLVNVLSIPRDTLVHIPGRGFDKINAAHAYGGPAMTVATVEGILGVPIHHHVEVNFQGAQKLFDVLGGIDIDVEKHMTYVDHTAKLKIELKKGRQHLNGYQAAGYIRFRHDNYGDIGRVYRQQRFLKAVTEKLRQPATLMRLPQLISTGMQYVRTDMSTIQLGALAMQALRATEGRPSLPTAMVPGYSTTRRASYWIMDRVRTERLVQDLLIGNGMAGGGSVAPVSAATPAAAPPAEGAPAVAPAASATPARPYRPTVSVIVTRADLRPYKALVASLERGGFRVLGVQTDYAHAHPYTHVDSHEGADIPELTQELVRGQLLALVGTERVNIIERTRQGADFTVICGDDFPGLPAPVARQAPATRAPVATPAPVESSNEGIFIQEVAPVTTDEP